MLKALLLRSLYWGLMILGVGIIITDHLNTPVVALLPLLPQMLVHLSTLNLDTL